MILASEEKIHREQGKKWTLRKVYQFGMVFDTEKKMTLPNNCEYKVLGYRNPKAGEWFLSGAIVSAYKATNDQSQPMLVVEPTTRRKLRNITAYV